MFATVFLAKKNVLLSVCICVCVGWLGGGVGVRVWEGLVHDASASEEAR